MIQIRSVKSAHTALTYSLIYVVVSYTIFAIYCTLEFRKTSNSYISTV